MKTRIMRTVTLILLVVMLATLLTGCASSGVKSLISKFETACVEADAEMLLDCIDPNVSKPIRSVLELVGADDLNGIISDIFKLIDFINFKGEDPAEVLATVSIKPEAYVFNDAKDRCTVTATISYQIKNTEESRTIVFNCVLRDEEWYVKGTDF